ncbi:phage tail protein [Prosthecomicrobium hirschii]|uniref:tail protein X n=1 Tax=Prosthecodimorpha hirschii TaxID=665126 RepID=UPI00112884DA|nr:tail protein X [Prosthecomicrobium hirschii]TPQ48971.1 phage tail protein [Prosthecomicrobium hirschii]
MPVVTVRARGITLERLVFKVAGGLVPGLVERTLEANPDLAQASDELVVGTRIVIPEVGELKRARTIPPLRLVD